MSEDLEVASSTSHKGEKVRSYTTDFKLEVARYAEESGIKAAGRKFKVAPKTVREWRDKKAKFEELRESTTAGGKRLRLAGGGRHVTDADLEEHLLEWISERRGNGFRVSRKLIKKKKKKLQEENGSVDVDSKSLVFSDGWVQKFMARNGLCVRRRTTEAQKSPDQLVDKLCAYIVKVRRLRQRMNYDLKNIIAMDETAIWSDMISNSTVERLGAHSVNLKTTGHEKAKITVCLSATADGGKKKPFFVFKGVKREVKVLNEEFRLKCVVASSPSGWMNDELTQQFCGEVLGTFTFGTRRLLAWDAFRCHLTPEIKAILSQGRIDPIIVPGGCTKFIQAPDVSWNKPMKEYLREMYDQWLSEEEHQLTAQGNMRAPSRKQMIEWVLEAWKKLPNDLIKKSFKICALSGSLDASEDDQIMCIKYGPCKDLLSRLQILDEEEVNPFEVISEEETTMEDIPELEIDSDNDEDEDVEVD